MSDPNYRQRRARGDYDATPPVRVQLAARIEAEKTARAATKRQAKKKA